jgi:phosphinothricin acetyltransferase
MTITIRPALIADAARCAEIYRPFVTDNWVSFEIEPPDAREMADRIGRYGESHAWLVAQDENKRVIGYAYSSPHRTRAAYDTSADVGIYVDPAAARRGAGRALYAALFPLLREKGVHAIFSGIALPNPGSIALHEAMGFTPVGIYREVGWKMGGWRDVGWWQRIL